MLEVVEQNDLQHQVLSSDDERRQIQGQKKVLEHCELGKSHTHSCDNIKKNQSISIIAKNDINTVAGSSVIPRPRCLDMTKAVAVQLVMLSGTVRANFTVSESLQTQNTEITFIL